MLGAIPKRDSLASQNRHMRIFIGNVVEIQGMAIDGSLQPATAFILAEYSSISCILFLLIRCSPRSRIDVSKTPFSSISSFSSFSSFSFVLRSPTACCFVTPNFRVYPTAVGPISSARKGSWAWEINMKRILRSISLGMSVLQILVTSSQFLACHLNWKTGNANS